MYYYFHIHLLNCKHSVFRAIPSKKAIPEILQMAKQFPNVTFIACTDETTETELLINSTMIKSMKHSKLENVSIAQGSFAQIIPNEFYVNQIPWCAIINKLGKVCNLMILKNIVKRKLLSFLDIFLLNT